MRTKFVCIGFTNKKSMIAVWRCVTCGDTHQTGCYPNVKLGELKTSTCDYCKNRERADYVDLVKMDETKDLKKDIQKYSFELITDVYHNNSGSKRYAKRKTIFTHHLKQLLKNRMETVQRDIESLCLRERDEDRIFEILKQEFGEW